MPCELEIDTDDPKKSPGLTLYTNLYKYKGKNVKPKGDTKCFGKDVGVYIPPACLNSSNKLLGAQLSVVLWLHGMDVRDPVDFFRNNRSDVRDQVRKSGIAVVVIVPHLGHRFWGTDKATGEAVAEGDTLSLGDFGGKALDEVLAGLNAKAGGSAPKLTIKNLVIACHSGGGAVMRQLAKAIGNFDKKLNACWGFDCLYSRGDAKFWYDWVKENDVPLYIVFGNTTMCQSIWLYSMKNGRADAGTTKEKAKTACDETKFGHILDPADKSKKVQKIFVAIANATPTPLDTDMLLDQLLFPPSSGSRPPKKVATVRDAVANANSFAWPVTIKDSKLHYFTTTFFQELLTKAGFK